MSQEGGYDTQDPEIKAAVCKRLAAEAEKLAAETRGKTLEADKAAVDLAMAQLVLQAKQREDVERAASARYNNLYYFTSEVRDASVREVMKRVAEWRHVAKIEGRKPQETPFELIFTSPGGDVLEGLVLFDFLQQVQRDGYPVITGTYGYAASMAGILLQAGGKRWIGRGAWVLIHEISLAALGKIGEVEDTVAWLRRIQQHITRLYAERAVAAGGREEEGKPWESVEAVQEYIEKNWQRKDWWLSSEECLLHGFVDEVR